jgi:hypothetical protein
LPEKQRVPVRKMNSTPPVPAPSNNSNNPFEAFDSEPNLFPSDAAAGGAVNEWDATALRSTPQRQENTQKISDAFDQAWVSLPPSSFSAATLFSEPTTPPARTAHANTTPSRRPASQTVPTTPKSLQLPKRQPQDLNQAMDMGGIEVSLVEEVPSQQETPTTIDGKEKRRGFFSAFKRKDTKSKKGSSASPGRLSAYGEREQPIAASPRGRRGSRNGDGDIPSRSKSVNSVERFRSASMAHKFSRVNRLYDNDD